MDTCLQNFRAVINLSMKSDVLVAFNEISITNMFVDIFLLKMNVKYFSSIYVSRNIVCLSGGAVSSR